MEKKIEAMITKLITKRRKIRFPFSVIDY